MAIRRRTPGVQPGTGTNYIKPTIRRNEGQFDTKSMVNSDSGIGSTIKFMSGKSMHTKKYYSQLTGADDIPTSLDTELSVQLQQYQSIENMELKVTSAIDVSNASNTTGTAIMAVNVIPQEFDLFTLNVAGNREALMRVTEVTKGHYNNNKIYTITYVIDSFKDESEERFNNLYSKVIREFIYDDNYNINHTSPVVSTSKFNEKVKIEKALKKLYIDIVRSGFNSEHNTFMVPHDDYNIVDPILTDFIFKVIPYDTPGMVDLSNPYYGLDMLSYDNIWGAILNKDIHSIYTMKRDMALYARKGVLVTPFITNSVIVDRDNIDPLRLSQVPVDMLPNFGEDDYSYLLTKEFYTEDSDKPSLSLLERCLLTYLSNDDPNVSDIFSMINTYRYWTRLERFYYMPLLLALSYDVVTRHTGEYI